MRYNTAFLVTPLLPFLVSANPDLDLNAVNSAINSGLNEANNVITAVAGGASGAASNIENIATSVLADATGKLPTLPSPPFALLQQQIPQNGKNDSRIQANTFSLLAALNSLTTDPALFSKAQSEYNAASASIANVISSGQNILTSVTGLPGAEASAVKSAASAVGSAASAAGSAAASAASAGANPNDAPVRAAQAGGVLLGAGAAALWLL